MDFLQPSFKWTSCKLRMNFLVIKHELFEISYEFLKNSGKIFRNLKWISYKFPMNFFQASYGLLICILHCLKFLMSFLESFSRTSKGLLINFFLINSTSTSRKTFLNFLQVYYKLPLTNFLWQWRHWVYLVDYFKRLHEICFILRSSQDVLRLAAVTQEFYLELKRGRHLSLCCGGRFESRKATSRGNRWELLATCWSI